MRAAAAASATNVTQCGWMQATVINQTEQCSVNGPFSDTSLYSQHC